MPSWWQVGDLDPQATLAMGCDLVRPDPASRLRPIPRSTSRPSRRRSRSLSPRTAPTDQRTRHADARSGQPGFSRARGSFRRAEQRAERAVRAGAGRQGALHRIFAGSAAQGRNGLRHARVPCRRRCQGGRSGASHHTAEDPRSRHTGRARGGREDSGRASDGIPKELDRRPRLDMVGGGGGLQFAFARRRSERSEGHVPT